MRFSPREPFSAAISGLPHNQFVSIISDCASKGVAVAAVADKYSLSRGTVRRILRLYGPRFRSFPTKTSWPASRPRPNTTT